MIQTTLINPISPTIFNPEKYLHDIIDFILSDFKFSQKRINQQKYYLIPFKYSENPLTKMNIEIFKKIVSSRNFKEYQIKVDSTKIHTLVTLVLGSYVFL